MKPRQLQLLNYTVKYHIKTAQPVGSNLLSAKTSLRVSPATIRNELLELEEEGYLYQPHTSAGRVPTEKGYRFWIDNFLKEKEISKQEKRSYQKIKKTSSRDYLKDLSKKLAENTCLAVIMSFTPRDVYYTGISYLFSQPEFKRYELIYNISQVVDRIDSVIDDFFEKTQKELSILIGSENPVSKECSLLSWRFNKNSLLSILGPMRMDYEKNIASLRYVLNLIKKYGEKK